MLQAAVVARIVRERAQGRSLTEIARGLEHDGVPTARGGSRWWPSSVRWALGRAGGLDVPPDLQPDEESAAAPAPDTPAGPAVVPDVAPAPRRPRRRRRRTGSAAAGGGPA